MTEDEAKNLDEALREKLLNSLKGGSLMQNIAKKKLDENKNYASISLKKSNTQVNLFPDFSEIK